MRILLLGGTRFVGRHVAEAALERGYNVTLFHRGKSAPEGLPGTKTILGDRFEDLDQLAAEPNWDLAIDSSAYFPRAVRTASQALRTKVGRMAFVSTISVYASPDATRPDDARLTVADPDGEIVNGETYGGLKALCEDQFLAAWGSDGWIVRPGLITGPYDPTDRFAYWVDRVRRFHAIVPPSRLDQPFQVVDGRALGEFLLDGLKAGATQTVNTVGPSTPITMGGLLEMAAQVLGVSPVSTLARPTELSLPCELPEDGKEDRIFQMDPTPAEALGLKLPSMENTLRSTAEWMVETGRTVTNPITDAIDEPR